MDDNIPGTWVVGYKVYRDSVYVGMVYSSRFMEPAGSWPGSYEVRAVSASGLVSAPSKIFID